MKIPQDTTNVTGKSKQAREIIKPKSVEEVCRFVCCARISGIPLYPISTGFNWGYGSRSPASDNCDLIDLGGMNRILNADSISLDNPVALIEPGVTQSQLHDFLKANVPELMFNVTGSGKDTSIIGNALDRGVGYVGPRKNDLFGLEIVIGTGEKLYTGFRRLSNTSPLAYSHPFGLGPILDGLFFQGNFGIVTSACFKLFPRRPKEVVVSFSLEKRDNFPLFINEVARLKRDGLLTSVAHIANTERSRATLAYGITSYLSDWCNLSQSAASKEAEKAMKIVLSGEWTSLASVSGNAQQVRGAIKEIRSRLKVFGRFRLVTDKLLDIGFLVTHHLRFFSCIRIYAAAISAMRPLHKLALGVPTDIAVKNLLWKFNHLNLSAAELDSSRCGLLYINPALPLDGYMLYKVIKDMDLIAKQYSHVLYITINIETETSLVAIINLLFDRSQSEEVSRAHGCADALLAYIHNEGLEVYRARADMMGEITSNDSNYWDKIRSLKKVFDPDNIIAPGRYNLP